MKKIFFVFLAIATTVVSKAQSEADMKAWQAFMTPGDMHKTLAQSAGNWKAEMTMWMMPGSEPTKSMVTAKHEMILGGRYLQQTYAGSFMGAPFEGIATTGFDNGKKIFLSTWIDNMGSGIMVMEGKWNGEKSRIELQGKQTDPVTGKDMKVRENHTFNNDGTQLMEMWMEHEGKEFKAMEIRFTKA